MTEFIRMLKLHLWIILKNKINIAYIIVFFWLLPTVWVWLNKGRRLNEPAFFLIYQYCISLSIPILINTQINELKLSFVPDMVIGRLERPSNYFLSLHLCNYFVVLAGSNFYYLLVMIYMNHSLKVYRPGLSLFLLLILDLSLFSIVSLAVLFASLLKRFTYTIIIMAVFLFSLAEFLPPAFSLLSSIKEVESLILTPALYLGGQSVPALLFYVIFLFAVKSIPTVSPEDFLNNGK